MTLPARNVDVALIARSGDLASEPARVSLVWSGAARSDLLKPNLYALVIGVSDYEAPDLPPLQFAGKDARDFAHALMMQKGGLYGDVEVRVLDQRVTRDGIMEGLEWLEKQVTSRDIGVLFLAGHATMDEKQTYWFLPSNASPASIRRHGVSQDDLKRTMYNLSGKAVWFLDTCHAAGAFSGTARGEPLDINRLINDMTASENGVVAFASSQGREVSFERSDWRNGAFTRAIVEGIEDGGADLYGNGTITISALDAFVVHRVKQLTDGKQHPVMTRPKLVSDFPIAVKRK